MKARNINEGQLRFALAQVNANFGYKLIFNRTPERKGNFFYFTIRSKKSKILGAAISGSGRNTCAASWEAHGHFFNECFNLSPNAEIRTAKETYFKDTPWKDYNIGSQMSPMMASENAYIE